MESNQRKVAMSPIGGPGRSWSCGPPELTPGPLLPSGDPGGGRLPGAPHPVLTHSTPTTGAIHTPTVCDPINVIQVPAPATVACQSGGFTMTVGMGGGEACVCPHCGKCLRDKYKVRRHIEDVHTPSSHSHQCTLCHRHYKTRNTLQNHMSIYHRQPRRPR
ncbi:Broad-complex core protein-like 5 [Homarus americanus]|uniref:Broad-complex core protein-like 5 n=1 Tax=Homarus americanus TaxID=6706 RepID=A0A8J5KC98_HOMAM|nr:Broad-complex core protein-like 5 [Homarus americanus]